MSGRERWSQPPTILEAEAALTNLAGVIKKKRNSFLDRLTNSRYSAIVTCLYHLLYPKCRGFIEASPAAAVGQGHGGTYARPIRSWIHTFIDSGKLPKNQYGYWNVSMLDDEAISDKIKLHLLGIGKYVHATDLVEFIPNSVTRTQLGLTKTISIRTAQRWLSRVLFTRLLVLAFDARAAGIGRFQIERIEGSSEESNLVTTVDTLRDGGGDDMQGRMYGPK